MTTDNEAAAVEAEALDAAMDAWDNVYDGVSHNRREAMRAAIAAHTAASAGEVPEGRIRFDYTNADGRPDCKIITHDEMRQRYADLREQKNGWPPPPAAVPADALLALQNDIMEIVGTCDDVGQLGNEMIGFANRIAALIPKGADHA